MAAQAVNLFCIVKRDYVSRTTRDGAAHGQVFAHTAGPVKNNIIKQAPAVQAGAFLYKKGISKTR